MSIDFSGTEYENEELEPLVTTSLTREDEGRVPLRPKTLRGAHRPGEGQGQFGGIHPGG